MGLFDAINIGSNALLAQQAAIQVTGNNIANSATPGYTRQEAILAPHGTSTFGPGLQAGGGVQLQSVNRMVDNSLQQRLNDANGQMQENLVAETTLEQIESLMNEMSDTDLSNGLLELFNSFDALAADPASMANRDIVINRAETLVERFQYISNGLSDIQSSLTEQLNGAVIEANELADQIAKLNVQIVQTETGGGSAATLRDQRDQALSQLSELVTISAREDDNGAVNVYLGSEMLVNRGISRGLSMEPQPIGENGESELVVCFSDNKGPVQLEGGIITGLQDTRDGAVTEVVNRVDTLAREVIWEVNKIHSTGTSLEGLTDITGTYPVADADAALNSFEAGLAFTPVNGSFNVSVSTTAPDGSVTTNTTQINVPLTGDATDMTLNDLVAAINAVPDLAAGVDANGAITIQTTSPNASVTFSDDTSGALAALGVNTFFTGSAASTIGVNEAVVENRNFIAAGLSDNPGDGDNAARIAALATDATDNANLGGRTLLQYHQEIITDLAVWTATASDTAAAQQVVYDSLTAQRESLSGVSIDEEAVNLMQYQRAFQGAARFLSVVDELMDTMLSMV